MNWNHTRKSAICGASCWSCCTRCTPPIIAVELRMPTKATHTKASRPAAYSARTMYVPRLRPAVRISFWKMGPKNIDTGLSVESLMRSLEHSLGQLQEGILQLDLLRRERGDAVPL
jgi:hypothetical protein